MTLQDVQRSSRSRAESGRLRWWLSILLTLLLLSVAAVVGLIAFTIDLTVQGEAVVLSSSEGRVLLEAPIKPQDRGFLDIGQRVRIWIPSKDQAIVDPLNGIVESLIDMRVDEPHFIAHLEAETKVLHSRTGSEVSILPGMAATVEIVTDEQSGLEHYLRKIGLWPRGVICEC